MKHYTLSYGKCYDGWNLMVRNIHEHWNAEGAPEELESLHITLKNNPELQFNDKTYYGVEDDYCIYFLMTEDEVIDYLCEIVSER